MSDTVLDKGLNWALDWVDKEVHINWYGGEPLLGFDQITRWVPIWDKAFKRQGKKIRWGITTNGLLMKEPVRDFIDTFDIGILFSIDGPPWVHNNTRVYYNGKPTWDDIPVDEILQWNPDIEIAWQLDCDNPFCRSDLDWMMDKGFKRINFNINWLKEWNPEKRIILQDFFRYVGLLTIEGKLLSNWKVKLDAVLEGRPMMEQPCGMGTGMLALTPEGDLYPSQEMAFLAYEPDRAEGTADYYRVGNVLNSPVINEEALERIGKLKTKDIITPKGFDCDECVAAPISLKGCHCRYIGGHNDPSYRYDALIGYCQSMEAAMTGMLQAAKVKKYTGVKPWKQKCVTNVNKNSQKHPFVHEEENGKDAILSVKNAI